MGWQLKLLVTLLLCVLAATGVVEYNNAIENAERAEAAAFNDRRALEEVQREFSVLKQQYDIQEAVLLEKQGYEDAIREKLRGVYVRLDRLRAADPVAQEWSTTPIPSSVRSLMRDDGGPVYRPGDLRAPVGGADDPNSRTEPTGIRSGNQR